MTWTTNVLDCKRASELMPLYAADDLEDARAGDVALHLASCDACSRLAGEFAESRRLLIQAFATPKFGAEFYAGIRGDVLARVGRDREPSSPASLLATLFGRRFIYTASLALVIIACGLVFRQFRHTTRETTSGLESARNVEHEPPPIQRSDSSSHAPAPQTQPHMGNGKESATQYVATGSASRRHAPRRAATDRHDAIATMITARDDRDAVARAMPSSVNGTQTTVESASSSATAKVSRIEIQTADPNIRIIWLAPQKPEEPKIDRDQHENGDRK
jgi:hypothetical protein